MYFEGVDSKDLTKDNILSAVRDETLWSHYLGRNITFTTQQSPFRSDPNPSFSVYRHRTKGKIMAQDHGGTFLGDIFDLVGALYRTDFSGALAQINQDFGLGLKKGAIVTVSPRLVTRREVPKASRIIFEAEERNLLQSDVEYWGSYGIRPDTLTRFDVHCVNVARVNGQCWYTYKPEDPCYEYRFVSGNSKYYRPWAEKALKFRGNIDGRKDIQGLHQCRVDEVYDGKMLVLTKSMKDVMLISQYDIDSMAAHGESHGYDDEFMNMLLACYPRVVSLYDNDKAGRAGAQYLLDRYGVQPKFVPESAGKDVTDMYRKDRKAAEGLIQSLRQYD